jgi:hypothetical protein
MSRASSSTFAPDEGEVRARTFGQGAILLQRRGRHQGGGQGSAQFMRECGQEIVFGSVGPLRDLLRDAQGFLFLAGREISDDEAHHAGALELEMLAVRLTASGGPWGAGGRTRISPPPCGPAKMFRRCDHASA